MASGTPNQQIPCRELEDLRTAIAGASGRVRLLRTQCAQPKKDIIMLGRSMLKAWVVYSFELANLSFRWLADMSHPNGAGRGRRTSS